MNVFRSIATTAGVAALALGFSLPAAATAGYCVDNNVDPVQSDGLALNDVTFTIGTTDYHPTDCYGITNTGSSNIATVVTFVNNLRWEDFTTGVQDLPTGGGSSVTVDGIAYTLTTGAQTGTGTSQTELWTLSWSDTNGAALPNLPVLVDFALDWKGGNNDVLYLFTNVLLPLNPTSGSGTIDIKVTNPPGNSDLGTSHLDVLLSSARVPPSEVPEPASLALLGMALLAAFGVRRRSRAR